MYYGLLGLASNKVPAFTGILDTYTGAAVAYSAARRLSSSYTGALIRVRRSSDNTEQDIGYDSGNILDTSALTTFVGANSAYVTTMYDQSGNAKNAVQSTATYQPRIVNAGTIETLLSKPTFNFDGNGNTGFQLDFSSGTYSAASAFSVYNRANATSDNAIIYTQTAAFSTHQPFSDGATYDGFFMTNRLSLGGSMTTAGTYILNLINNGTQLRDYWVGSTNNTTNLVSGTFNKPAIYRIGQNATWGGSASIGKFTEHILWLSDKTSDRSGINTNINSFYSIYP